VVRRGSTQGKGRGQKKNTGEGGARRGLWNQGWMIWKKPGDLEIAVAPFGPMEEKRWALESWPPSFLLLLQSALRFSAASFEKAEHPWRFFEAGFFVFLCIVSGLGWKDGPVEVALGWRKKSPTTGRGHPRTGAAPHIRWGWASQLVRTLDFSAAIRMCTRAGRLPGSIAFENIRRGKNGWAQMALHRPKAWSTLDRLAQMDRAGVF